MTKFRFTITTDVTASATVEVEADTIAEAQEIALNPVWFNDPSNASFQIDDGNIATGAYLPDASDFEELPDSPAPGL